MIIREVLEQLLEIIREVLQQLLEIIRVVLQQVLQILRKRFFEVKIHHDNNKGSAPEISKEFPSIAIDHDEGR